MVKTVSLWNSMQSFKDNFDISRWPLCLSPVTSVQGFLVCILVTIQSHWILGSSICNLQRQRGHMQGTQRCSPQPWLAQAFLWHPWLWRVFWPSHPPFSSWGQWGANWGISSSSDQSWWPCLNCTGFPFSPNNGSRNTGAWRILLGPLRPRVEPAWILLPASWS